MIMLAKYTSRMRPALDLEFFTVDYRPFRNLNIRETIFDGSRLEIYQFAIRFSTGAVWEKAKIWWAPFGLRRNKYQRLFQKNNIVNVNEKTSIGRPNGKVETDINIYYGRKV